MVKIALAGNPNSGKTTLFNGLTGANQFVGNWPGVTVEKKEGHLKGNKEVLFVDLPGIYSLSPYTLEEVVARNFLINERPDAILNIVDGTNLERNLYLTTQLTELGIPVVMAVNMMDMVEKRGDTIDFAELKKQLGCEIVAVSALKGRGIKEAAERAVRLAGQGRQTEAVYTYDEKVETYLQKITARMDASVPDGLRRFCAVKLFEGDEKIGEQIKNLPDVTDVVKEAELELKDDTESILTDARYAYIASVMKKCYKKKNKEKRTVSDKIDRVVTNRFLALPIFAVVMFIVYFVSVTTVGTWATDWTNDGLFGDGWHFLGIGSAAYEEAVGAYETETAKIDSFIEAAEEVGISADAVTETLEAEVPDREIIDRFITEAAGVDAVLDIEDEEGGVKERVSVSAADFDAALEAEEPDPADFGIWVPGIPVLIGNLLAALGTSAWLESLILDGIVAGVGAVLGFVPQMLVLFIFLAFLEGCGYMARIAFIMDRIFRKFGLSGKSFIPMLIGSGCGVPGIMASRTIENDRDRKMTIMTTTFIPCGAKLPIIALISGALFGGAWWVAFSAYFVGIAAIIVSGIILKKTRMFAGDPAPFVMELPAYHLPTPGNVLRSMWERGWSFIKKAGTIILLSTIFIWFTSNFGFVDGKLGMVEDLSDGFLAAIGSGIAWLFRPLGWGNWQAAVAAITGLVAKENVVGTFGILYGFAEVAEDGLEVWGTLQAQFTTIAAYSFLVFNLLCAPCFAAIGAIRREMNNAGWTWFAIGYETVFAYAAAFCIYQIGSFFAFGTFGIGTVLAFLVVAAVLYLLFRPQRNFEKYAKKQLA